MSVAALVLEFAFALLLCRSWCELGWVFIAPPKLGDEKYTKHARAKTSKSTIAKMDTAAALRCSAPFLHSSNSLWVHILVHSNPEIRLVQRLIKLEAINELKLQ